MRSNPYLQFSIDQGVDYGDVLSFIDAYEKQFKNLTYWQKKACQKLQHTTTSRFLLELRRQVRIEVFKDEQEAPTESFKDTDKEYPYGSG